MNHPQKSLRNVPQIKNARVSLARKQAKLELKSGQKLSASLKKLIKKAIARAGYTPRASGQKQFNESVIC